MAKDLIALTRNHSLTLPALFAPDPYPRATATTILERSNCVGPESIPSTFLMAG
jgi:hypothetical protein